MFYTIYQITHKDSGKIYIGKHQTKNIDDSYMGSGKLLSYAKKKHGLDAFSKKILYIFNTEEEMNDKEAELVTEEFCARKDTYNICPGGKGGWGYVNANGKAVSLSEQRRRDPTLAHRSGKIAAKVYLKKRLENPEWAKMVDKNRGESLKGNQSFLGKTHSEETKRKMSKKAKERLKDPTKNSQYGTIWITNGTEYKKIKKDDLIPVGWRRGRK